MTEPWVGREVKMRKQRMAGNPVLCENSAEPKREQFRDPDGQTVLTGVAAIVSPSLVAESPWRAGRMTPEFETIRRAAAIGNLTHLNTLTKYFSYPRGTIKNWRQNRRQRKTPRRLSQQQPPEIPTEILARREGGKALLFRKPPTLRFEVRSKGEKKR